MSYGSDSFNEMVQESRNKMYEDIYLRIPSMSWRVELFNDIQRKAGRHNQRHGVAKQRSRMWRPRSHKTPDAKERTRKDDKTCKEIGSDE